MADPTALHPWIDDDGSGTVGTVLNEAARQNVYRDLGPITQTITTTGTQTALALPPNAGAGRSVLFLNNASTLTIQGLAAPPSNVDAMEVLLVPINGTVTIQHQNAGASAANRIIAIGAADITISGPTLLSYDLSNGPRWRMLTIDANLFAGTFTLASQATNDLMVASSMLQWGRLGIGSALQGLRVNAAGNGLEYAAIGASYQLLKSNSGVTGASDPATNVDTVTMGSGITALTAKDTLMVFFSIEAASGATITQPLLQNSTDTVTVKNLYTGNLGSTLGYASTVTIRQLQSAATAIAAYMQSGQDTAGSNEGGNSTYATFSTAWSGSWTLALRHGGTSGGVLKWSWAVYRVLGQ